VYAGDLGKDGRADVVTDAGAKVLALLNRPKQPRLGTASGVGPVPFREGSRARPASAPQRAFSHFCR
jgi:hypothetical protein